MHTYINTYNIIKVPTLVYGNEYLSFPGGSVVKNPSASAEDAGFIPGLGRSPGEGNGNSLQYSCLENPHGQRSLVGYSPWSRKKSDTTEQSTKHSTAQE